VLILYFIISGISPNLKIQNTIIDLFYIALSTDGEFFIVEQKEGRRKKSNYSSLTANRYMIKGLTDITLLLRLSDLVAPFILFYAQAHDIIKLFSCNVIKIVFLLTAVHKRELLLQTYNISILKGIYFSLT